MNRIDDDIIKLILSKRLLLNDFDTLHLIRTKICNYSESGPGSKVYHLILCEYFVTGIRSRASTICYLGMDEYLDKIRNVKISQLGI